MIKIFSRLDKDFSSNGDIVVNPIRAKVHKEDNGDFYLELEADLSYLDYLVEGNIIVADIPQGAQAFRVFNIQKSHSRLYTKARHVFYDSEHYLIPDSYVVDKNCNDALVHLNSATDSNSPFTVSSDITATNSFRCVRKSLYEAIQTVLERWGGHLVRDNFTIGINSEIGQDKGVTVRYGKNLKSIKCVEYWNDVVTKLLPVGKDGIMLNSLNKDASIYIYSPIVYELPFTKTVTFSQSDIEEEDYPDETTYKQALIDDLKAQAESYIKVNYLPKVNYTLDANLERITDIGDTVEVIDERLDLRIVTHVTAFEYDCILERYTEVVFGNFLPTFASWLPRIMVV